MYVTWVVLSTITSHRNSKCKVCDKTFVAKFKCKRGKPSGWLYFAKFHLDTFLKVLCNIIRIDLVFGQILNQMAICFALGHIFIVRSGQICQNTQAIWSHWKPCILLPSSSHFSTVNFHIFPTKVFGKQIVANVKSFSGFYDDTILGFTTADKCIQTIWRFDRQGFVKGRFVDTWFALPSIPHLSGKEGLNLDLGLVTSCCSHQTACWRPACCWLG